jgi:hypothetical protein
MQQRQHGGGAVVQLLLSGLLQERAVGLAQRLAHRLLQRLARLRPRLGARLLPRLLLSRQRVAVRVQVRGQRGRQLVGQVLRRGRALVPVKDCQQPAGAGGRRRARASVSRRLRAREAAPRWVGQARRT